MIQGVAQSTRGDGRAAIARPPKSRFFKTDQTPLELGKCLGLGKGKGLGTGKHRHKGKGKDTGQMDRTTHSRRRAKRGGGYFPKQLGGCWGPGVFFGGHWVCGAVAGSVCATTFALKTNEKAIFWDQIVPNTTRIQYFLSITCVLSAVAGTQLCCALDFSDVPLFYFFVVFVLPAPPPPPKSTALGR